MVFLTGLWKFINYLQFIGKCEKVDAIVEEVHDRVTHKRETHHGNGVVYRHGRTIYAIYVTYSYQGKTYEHIQIDGYDVVWKGSELEIYVNKNSPTDVRLPENNLYQSIIMTLMLPVFGLVSILLKKSSNT